MEKVKPASCRFYCECYGFNKSENPQEESSFAGIDCTEMNHCYLSYFNFILALELLV